MVLGGCDFMLGASFDTEETLHACVYDFRIWSRALTVTDVAEGRKVRKIVYFVYGVLSIILY